MKTLGQMLKQAQEMQQRMSDLEAGLESIEVEGRSGGGMVVVRLNAKGEMCQIKIDPSLLSATQAEVLEDLILAAHGDAREKAQARMQEEMAKLTGGLGLPEGFKLPF